MRVDSSTSEAQILLSIISAMLLHPFYAVWVLLRGRKDWVELQKSATFDAPRQDVMRLLDPASRLNRWALRGDALECVDHAEKRYRLVDRQASEHPHIITVLEQHADTSIAYATRIESDDPMMKIEGSADTYYLESTQSGGTKITLTMIVKFKPGLSLLSHAFHECLYRRAAQNDLRRLDIELNGAQGGLAAAQPG